MTTLADKFMMAAQDKRLDDFSLGQVQGVAHDLAQAQKFVMSPDVREACRDFMTMKPSSLLEACAYARPPFSKTWLEWPPYNGPTLKSDLVAMPTKLGAMITDLGNGAFSFYTAWSYDRSNRPLERLIEVAGLSDSAMEVGVDFTQTMFQGQGWRGLPGNADKMTTEQLVAGRDDRHNAIRHMIHDMDERAAYSKIESCLRIRVRPNQTSIDQAKLAMEFGRDGTQAMLDDVREEIGPVIAMLILLNARNGVERTSVTHSPKLQKARAKNGKPPLVEYSTVEMRLSRALREAQKSGMTHAAAKGHIVLGHFKVRKSGVFWWNSHLRGDFGAGEIKRDHYEVVK